MKKNSVCTAPHRFRSARVFAGAVFLLLLPGCRNALSPELKDLHARVVENSPGRCVLQGERETVTLTSGSARIMVSGTPVILPLPVTRTSFGGCSLYPELCRTVLAPILFPPPRKMVRTILLDPGHGGSDKGAPCAAGAPEKEKNLLLAFAIREELQKRGFRVVMTRSTDRTLALGSRGTMARACQADLFLSVHHNSAPANPRAAGIETFVLRPPDPTGRCGASLPFALAVQRAMIRATGSTDRGVKFARFRVLCDAECPALLIEAGFLSHPQEGAACGDPLRRAKIAAAVAETLSQWQKTEGGKNESL